MDASFRDKVKIFIDNNPEKWGKYIGKFALQICQPDYALNQFGGGGIDAIIIPNKNYFYEIKQYVSKKSKRKISIIPIE